MNPAFIPVLMIALFAVTVALIVWFGAKSSAKAKENMRRLAGSLGLEATNEPPTFGIFHPLPRAAGRIRGKSVELYNYTTGSGKSRRTWSAVAVTPAADGGLTFALSRQGFGSAVRSLFGAKEITVGHAEFDRTWFIQTNQPDFFRAALLPEVQEKFRPFDGTFKLEHGKVTYVEEGMFSDDERCRRFESVAALACDLADIAEVHAHGARR